MSVQYSQSLWLKDVGFITFLKPTCISVMAANNWVPAPFSKMSTNALRTLSKFLSNTLISSYFIKNPQAALKASAFTPVKHAINFQQKFRRYFRVGIMLSDNARLQLRKRPDLSIQTLHNGKAYTNNTAVGALWTIHIQDNFLQNWKFFLDPIRP